MENVGKTSLTNEEIGKKFVNNFDLVNYAIKLAENMIETGRDARVKSDIQNCAMLVLEEIREGKDYFDEVKEVDEAPGTKNFETDGLFTQSSVYEQERAERQKPRMTEAYSHEL